MQPTLVTDVESRATNHSGEEMPLPHSRSILTVLGLAASLSMAQQGINPKPIERLDILSHQLPDVYQGQMVVAVTINTHLQLREAMDLAESSWSERPGLGRNILQIKSTNLDALTQLGVNPIVQIADLHAHNQQNWSSLVTQERFDIANNIGAHRPALDFQRGGSSHDENWFTGYKQLADIYTYMDTQVSAHPDLITKADIGDTIESRDIYSFTITAPDEPGNLAEDRPVIMWNGAQHAREWVSPMTVTYIASKLLDDADSDPEVQALLSSIRFVIIPVSNPDGYLYSWSDERYWRKNRRNNPGSFEGVDLNRNWDSTEFAGAGTSSDFSSDIYHGGSPFSEPETTAISNLATSYGDDLASHIDFHCFSQLILWPLGYADGLVTPEPDRTNFANLSGDMSSLIQSISGEFYDPIQSWQLYPAAGTCSDWFYEDRGVTSFTVELRPDSDAFDGFNPPASIILPTAQENWEASKLFAARTTQAMSLSHTPIAVFDADTPTPVFMTASPGVSEIDPSTAVLHTRIGSSGPFDQVMMTPSGGSTYTGHLPSTPCGQTVEYYFTADSLSGASFTLPAGGASDPLDALSQLIIVAFEDDMENSTGWTVGQASDTATTGIWERANPQATAAQPEDDHTIDGSNCWVTDGDAGSSLGANDIDGGATTLTSPTMDATIAGEGAELVYWRWYSNDTGAGPDADSMLVEISYTNGTSWSTLETVTENANAWVEKRFALPSDGTPLDQIRVRFIASDFNDGSIVEAGVDDLSISSTGCSGSPADINGDGELDFFDISAFLTLFANQDPIGDFNTDGEWDFFDISAFLTAFSAG
ncbi:MAG: M14 family zinc carboxypeptidase [Phycisphaerales bacterium]